MKKENVCYILVAWCMLSFFSCSSDELPALTESDDAFDELNVEPYISEGMQALIRQLDTQDGPIPLEKILPSLPSTLSYLSTDETSGLVTRAETDEDNIYTTTGYTRANILFSKQAVVVTLSDSSLRESLDFSYSFTGEDSETMYLTCKAVEKRMTYSEETILVDAYQSGDFMGIDPEYYDEDEDLTNDSQFSQGFYVNEVVSGKFFYLTTYVFELYLSSSSSTPVLILPSNEKSLDDFETYCAKITWRYGLY